MEVFHYLSKVRLRQIMVTTAISIIIFIQCSTLKDLANIQKPIVSLENIRVADLSFEGLDLLFEIGIENPNSLAVIMAGFNYEFYINNQLFLKGAQDSTQSILARSKSQLEIPVTLNFQKIYATYQSLKDKDSSSYRMQLGLMFDLPVIGKTTIPLSKEGGIPLIKLPKISVIELKLINLSLTSASFELETKLENPNSLNLILNQFQYNLKINERNWLSGVKNQAQTINSKSTQRLLIPFSINFLEIGQSVYQALVNNETLNYNFSGKINVGSPDLLLTKIDIPFFTNGSIALKR